MSPDGSLVESDERLDADATYHVTWWKSVSNRGLFLPLEREEHRGIQITLGWHPSVPRGSRWFEWDRVSKEAGNWLIKEVPSLFQDWPRLIERLRLSASGDAGGQGTHRAQASEFRRTRLWLGYAGNALTIACLAVFLAGARQRLAARLASPDPDRNLPQETTP